VTDNYVTFQNYCNLNTVFLSSLLMGEGDSTSRQSGTRNDRIVEDNGEEAPIRSSTPE
jgi:hypothetical protein